MPGNQAMRSRYGEAPACHAEQRVSPSRQTQCLKMARILLLLLLLIIIIIIMIMIITIMIMIIIMIILIIMIMIVVNNDDSSKHV